MGRQADDDSGQGQAPRPGDGLPGLLAAFEHGGAWDAAAPSAALAAALETCAGPQGLYDGAGVAALVGITRKWAALESYAAAGGLGSLRAMMREDAEGRPLLRRRTDLPDGWVDSLNYEIAGALAMGPVSAGHLARLAWTLGTRLPGIGRLLADGTLTKSKAKLIAATFEPLSEGEATRAEALILGELKGKTWYQVERLAWRAALAVAPDLAERRRRDAERRRARVTIFREESGAVGLSGRDLPAAEALSGHANVLARADQYERSGAFPDHTGSVLQALAYLHLLGGVSAEDAIAFARTATAEPPDAAGRDDTRPDDTRPDEDDDEEPDDPWGDDPGSDDPGSDDPGSGGPGSGDSWGDDPDDEDPWEDPWSGDPDGDDPQGGYPDGGDPSGQAGSGPGAPGNGQRPSDDEDEDEGPDGGVGPDGSASDAPGHSHSHSHSHSEGSGDDEGPDDDPDSGGDPGDGGDPGPGPAPPPGPGRGDPGSGAEPDGSSPGGGPRPGSDDHGDYGPSGAGGHLVLPEVTAPLATLQRRAERAGENRLLGPLDPALTRDLATAATRSPHAQWEITIVDDRGYATGHGTARPRRSRHQQPHPPPGAALNALPARVNITITETLLHQLAAQAAQPRSGAPPSDWDLAPRTAGAGDGAWALTLPGGRELTVRFDAVPTHSCDHRYEVNSYEPGDRLRRLVQVRDYECTFPPCSRPAKDSDFEHAIPYDKGGRTDACNAGARSRRCHQVKQTPGWTVTQPKPGWHVWTTPTGRAYTQEPWRYIALPASTEHRARAHRFRPDRAALARETPHRKPASPEPRDGPAARPRPQRPAHPGDADAGSPGGEPGRRGGRA